MKDLMFALSFVAMVLAPAVIATAGSGAEGASGDSPLKVLPKPLAAPRAAAIRGKSA